MITQDTPTTDVCSAEYSDGTRREVTWLTQFSSGDASVAEVDAGGKVRVLRPGETTVRATFMGQVAVVLITAPHEQLRIRPDRVREIEHVLRIAFVAGHVAQPNVYVMLDETRHLLGERERGDA